MSRRKKILIAAGVGALILALIVLLSPRKGARPSPPAPAQVQDSKHEVFTLEALRKEQPKHVPILLRLAQLYREQGRPADAIEPLREAVKLEPGNLEARLELGRALFETGDIEGAIEHTRALLEKDPNHADGLYNMGAIYANLGQATQAREYWQRLVAKAPDSPSGQKARDGLARLGKEGARQ